MIHAMLHEDDSLPTRADANHLSIIKHEKYVARQVCSLVDVDMLMAHERLLLLPKYHIILPNAQVTISSIIEN